MRLYHGSDVTIEKPDAIRSRKNLDFGSGFYATSYPKQAERWALRRSLRSHGKALVNVYEFDETANLHILRFNENDAEWVRFVCNCRRGGQPPLGTDLIIGGVADDKVYAAIDMYMRELWDMERTLQALAFYERNDQYCFLTPRSIAALRYVETYEVEQ